MLTFVTTDSNWQEEKNEVIDLVWKDFFFFFLSLSIAKYCIGLRNFEWRRVKEVGGGDEDEE